MTLLAVLLDTSRVPALRDPVVRADWMSAYLTEHHQRYGILDWAYLPEAERPLEGGPQHNVYALAAGSGYQLVSVLLLHRIYLVALEQVLAANPAVRARGTVFLHAIPYDDTTYQQGDAFLSWAPRVREFPAPAE